MGFIAWYQAAAASVAIQANNEQSSLTTTATAATDTINAYLDLTITVGTSIEPTLESDGYVYVISNGAVVKAANQDGLVKWGSNGSTSVVGLKKASDDSPLTDEDARALNGKKYKVTLSSDNSAGNIRIASGTAEAEEGKLERVVNASVDIGYVVITATGSSTTFAVTNASDTGNAFSQFYYAYNPEHTSTTPDTAGAKTVTLTATLTAQN